MTVLFFVRDSNYMFQIIRPTPSPPLPRTVLSVLTLTKIPAYSLKAGADSVQDDLTSNGKKG
jgi:hypothetical protein